MVFREGGHQHRRALLVTSFSQTKVHLVRAGRPQPAVMVLEVVPEEEIAAVAAGIPDPS